jgi:hypothetical protein
MLSGLTSYLRAGERLRAAGDVNDIWQLTHVGEYEGDVVTANIAGDMRPANYEAVPRVTYTDPQAAAVRSRRRKQRHCAGFRGAEDRHLHTRLRRIQRLPDAAEGAPPADRGHAAPPARPVDAQTASLSR